jgi:chorismate dehydratase
MARFRVGSVPFVNARPLVSWFESEGHDQVEVVYDQPSKLPRMLDERECDAVLVSSYDALRTPGRTIADGVCIGTDGPAESVKLFSKVPFGQVETLALDQSSLTSNALALGVLRETYGSDPVVENCPPDVEAMLESHDACVLIGDAGMEAKPEGLSTIDLGQAWSDMIGLPFVWAAWVGREDLHPELVDLLNDSWQWGKENMGRVVAEAVDRSGWSETVADHYLRQTMRYDLDEQAKQGLNTFALMLERNRVLTTAHRPRIVAPSRV